MFSIDRTKAEGTTLLKYFYTRRAFRIYPFSIAIVLAVVTLNIPVASWWFQSAPLTASTLASNLLLMQNLTYSPSVLGPLWTLPLEVQMYVILPFLYWAIQGGRRLDFAILIWCGAVALAFVQPHITERLSVFQFAPCFAAGIIAFTLTRRAKAFLPFWTLTVFVAIALYLFLAFTVAQDPRHLMRVSWILSLSVGFFLPYVKETKSNIVRSVSLTMAKYSYSIYLTHMIVLWVAFSKLQGANPLLRIFAGVSLMFLLPFATYNLIEAPGIALGGRVASRFLAARRPAAATSSPVAVNVVGS
jgi:peptidoglycan/LPS O-acetylase OafA/YrhL